MREIQRQMANGTLRDGDPLSAPMRWQPHWVSAVPGSTALVGFCRLYRRNAGAVIGLVVLLERRIEPYDPLGALRNVVK